MNPLVPTPDILPAAWSLIQLLLLLVFPLHLLAMNSLVGTAAVVLWARRRDGQLDRALAPHLTGALPVLMAVAVNLGVASLLFSQTLHGQFFYPATILMGRFWLAVIPLLITAYAGLYLMQWGARRPRRRTTLILAAILTILLIVPFIFTNNQTMMLNLPRWTAYFNADGGTLLNLGDATLWPRYLHFIVAALAVGGLFTALTGYVLGRNNPYLGAYAENLGLRLFGRMTLVQIGVGMLFLWELPQPIRWLMLGGSLPATLLLVTAVSLGLALLACSAQGLTRLCAGLLVVQVFVMSGLREMVRHASLAENMRLAETPMVWQSGALLIFILVLLTGLSVIGWLVVQALQTTDVAANQEQASEQNRALRS
jgi:hypothetical protein